MKKAKKIFKGLTKGHTSILLKFYNFFALCGPFGLKNIANRRNLTPKAIKAKKAAIRPNLAKLDCCKFLRVKQWSPNMHSTSVDYLAQV